MLVRNMMMRGSLLKARPSCLQHCLTNRLHLSVPTSSKRPARRSQPVVATAADSSSPANSSSSTTTVQPSTSPNSSSTGENSSQPGSDNSSSPASSAAASSTKAATSTISSNSSSSKATTTSSSSSSGKLTTDWEARRKQRVVNDLVEASKRLGPQFSREAIAAGVAQLEALLPGLQIDVEAMKASEWARLALDTEAAATRLVVLKLHYPRADLTRIMQRTPHLLLQDVALLEDNAKQVKQLLASARDPDALITALPSLMEPRNLISVLVTVQKWYFNKRDPVEVIESDPELILRAQECDIPFEPVYVEEGSGAWTAPSLAYHERRTDWQAYIDQKFYGQE